MKLVVRGDKYELEEALAGASIQTLKILAAASAMSGGERFDPVTPKSLSLWFEDLKNKSSDPEFDQTELLGDPVFLSHYQALVFLAKRRNREQITFDECGEFAPSDVSFEADEEPDDAPKDPEAPDPQV